MKVKVFHIRLTKEYLQIDQDDLNSFLDSVTVKKTATELVSGQPNYWSILVFYDIQNTEKNEKSAEKFEITSVSQLTVEEIEIFKVLKNWRAGRANKINVKPFVVAHNKVLMTIAKIKPKTLEELYKIKGFAKKKVEQYGEDIIGILQSI
jgi:superfamily II DNA helicase RecQ